MDGKFIAKVNARGTVWTSMYIAYDTLGYKMEAFGSTKNAYSTIEPIVVRPRDGKKGNGWEVLLYGDSVQLAETKSEAQREAEKLLDNERDSHGWPKQNTGRIY